MIPPSTPIDETLARLPAAARDLALPPGVRTAHDLVHAIRRGEVACDKALAKAILKAIEV